MKIQRFVSASVFHLSILLHLKKRSDVSKMTLSRCKCVCSVAMNTYGFLLMQYEIYFVGIVSNIRIFKYTKCQKVIVKKN